LNPIDVAAAPWWAWPIALFAVSFLIGIVAVLAGVGGGVLFVPIVGTLFPFHLDFVRGAGLMFALSGTLAAGPQLLRSGMASLRLVMPLALVGSIASFIGALVGLALHTQVLQTLLGALILGIALLIWRSRAVDTEQVEADALGAFLGLEGEFHDSAVGSTIDWRTHRTILGLAAFAGIGFIGGIVALYAFAWLANAVLGQATQQLDDATLAGLRQFSSPALDVVARIVSLLGSEAVLVAGVVLLGALGWQQRWGAAILLVMVTGGAQLLNDVLKELFHRTRPAPVGGFIEAQQFSFPSGHAMVSAAFYFVLAYLVWRLVRGWRRAMLVGGLIALVLLIGLARLYLGVHYLSDVIAGYIVGFLWTDAVIIGSHLLTVRRRLIP
jgi:membrane-associated phospholipid phosphatase